MLNRRMEPSNILVASRSPLAVKLADFGLPRSPEPLSQYWIAPERGSEEAHTEAGDIWSLGVVVMWLLDLLPQINSSSQKSVQWHHDLITRVNREYEGLVKKMKAKIFKTSIVDDLIVTLHDHILHFDPNLRHTSGQLEIAAMLHLEQKIEGGLEDATAEGDKISRLNIGKQADGAREPDVTHEAKTEMQPPLRRPKPRTQENDNNSAELSDGEKLAEEVRDTVSPRKRERRGATSGLLWTDPSGKSRLPR